jgi:hypothetical protein
VEGPWRQKGLKGCRESGQAYLGPYIDVGHIIWHLYSREKVPVCR